MGWNTVHALCGHTYEVQLEGRASARARKAEWLGDNRDCPDCYAKQLAADREAASVAAKAANADLPTLTGSPKQNAWAERIRYSAVSYLRELQEWLDQRPTEASVEDAAWSAMARKIIHDILHEEDSRVWIDNRDVDMAGTGSIEPSPKRWPANHQKTQKPAPRNARTHPIRLIGAQHDPASPSYYQPAAPARPARPNA